jgi:hypothetical protein
MSDIGSVKFRASAVGLLMVGGNAITEKQLVRLRELDDRKQDGNAKPLTPTMQAEYDDLVAKRDEPFKFGATALSFIRDTWLKNIYDFEEPLVTSELVKGFQCEDIAIGVLDRQVPMPGVFRHKNSESFEDDHFTGNPDILAGDEWVEDIKCSWNLRTFIEVQKPDPLYVTQGQVYMALTGRKMFRLAHVLVDTPSWILEDERKRMHARFGYDQDDLQYREACRKLVAMHTPSAKIPESQRIKCFEIHRSDRFIGQLRSRVEIARKVYASMTLEGGNSE